MHHCEILNYCNSTSNANTEVLENLMICLWCSCVADTEPRVLCAEQVNLLCQIAEAAMREMEGQHFMSLGSDALASMLRPKSCFKSPLLFCDISRNAWTVHFSNDAWADAAGECLLLRRGQQGSTEPLEIWGLPTKGTRPAGGLAPLHALKN